MTNPIVKWLRRRLERENIIYDTEDEILEEIALSLCNDRRCRLRESCYDCPLDSTENFKRLLDVY